MRSRGGAVSSPLGFTACALAVVTIGCGSAAPSATRPKAKRARVTTTQPPSTSTATTTTATTATTTPAPTTHVTIATPETVVTTPPTHASPSPPNAPAPLLVTQLSGIGSAQQVIAVAASSYGTSLATVTAYERGASGWKQTFGPWTAYIGRNGVAPAGAKREGDGRTPSGVYGFDFMFGVQPDPGVHYQYRHIGGSNIVWDDDPASPNYNEWIDTNRASAGADPEPMDNTPSYEYGAVIAYNDARTPGLGSAIFLHVSHGSSTAGCVSLPTDELLDLLRWLDPARSPRIAIGTTASLEG